METLGVKHLLERAVFLSAEAECNHSVENVNTCLTFRQAYAEGGPIEGFKVTVTTDKGYSPNPLLDKVISQEHRRYRLLACQWMGMKRKVEDITVQYQQQLRQGHEDKSQLTASGDIIQQKDAEIKEVRALIEEFTEKRQTGRGELEE